MDKLYGEAPDTKGVAGDPAVEPVADGARGAATRKPVEGTVGDGDRVGAVYELDGKANYTDVEADEGVVVGPSSSCELLVSVGDVVMMSLVRMIGADPVYVIGPDTLSGTSRNRDKVTAVYHYKESVGSTGRSSYRSRSPGRDGTGSPVGDAKVSPESGDGDSRAETAGCIDADDADATSSKYSVLTGAGSRSGTKPSHEPSRVPSDDTVDRDDSNVGGAADTKGAASLVGDLVVVDDRDTANSGYSPFPCPKEKPLTGTTTLQQRWPTVTCNV